MSALFVTKGVISGKMNQVIALRFSSAVKRSSFPAG